MGEDRADPDGVEMVEAPLKRLFQRGDLGAQPTLRELGEDGDRGHAPAAEPHGDDHVAPRVIEVRLGRSAPPDASRCAF